MKTLYVNKLLPNESKFRSELRWATGAIIFALGIPMLVLLGLVIYLVDSAKWADHSDEVIAQANHEELLLVSMQSGFRGYRLLKDPLLLTNYAQASAEINPGFEKLEHLVEDNHGQHDLAVLFHVKTDEWIKMINSLVQEYSTNQIPEGNLAFLPAAGNTINEALATGNKFLTEERRLRHKRENLLSMVTMATMAAFVVLAIAGIPILALWLQRLIKRISGQYQNSLRAIHLRATELEVTLSSIGDGVISTNADGKVQFLNPIAEILTGWMSADARGHELNEIFQIFNEHTGAAVDNPVARVIKENVIVGLANHTVLRSKGGQELPIEDSAAPIRDSEGKVLGVILVFHDVTLKRADERRLVEAEWRARSALEIGSAGSWNWEIAKDRVTGDAMLAKTFGVPVANCLSGEPLASFVQSVEEEDRPKLEAAIEASMKTGQPFRCEYRANGSDGQQRWIDARGRLEADALGQPDTLLGFFIDITERKNAEKAASEARERFRLLADVVEMQVWTAKPNGELDYANQQCVEYFAADLERDILGNAWAQYVHPEDLPAALQSWQKSLATGELYEVEFRLRAADGEFRWFLVRAKVMRDAEGRIVKWFGTNTDAHELKIAQREALKASHAKDDFLAALSHELRTPLTPVLMTAASLHEDERLPKDVRDQLGMMERNISLEARLIDDLLDLTTISRGKLQLRPQLCDVHSLIGLAIEIVQEDILTKGISIERNFSAKHCGLTADPARFQQVMWNLLRNAVKFTPPGGHISIRTLDDPSNWLHIEVADSGIGIDESSFDKIFHPFEQARTTGDHRFGGVGLGLAIARAIVDLHKGTIKAFSRGLNEGATFTVRLPGATSPPHGASDTAIASLAIQKNETDTAIFKKENNFKLLLVEDHAPTLQVLSNLLRRDGFQVLTAATISDGLATAEAHDVDLVISDLGLPDGNGIQLMKTLHDKHGLKGVALTGYGMEEDIARSREAGFVAHLIKPVHIAELRRVVRSLLDVS